MLLSTEAEVRDRVRGMQTGADDYIGKPYEPAYLAARARGLVRDVDEGAAKTVLIIDERELAASASNRDIALPTGKETILLVDDNDSLRRVTLRRLTGLGYQVEEAQDGPSALALFDAGRHFDLLFSDIGLPGGINGHVLADEARRRQPDLAVLLTPGYGNVGGRDGQPEDGAYIIRKPYHGNELATKLRQVLSARR